ncbi:hypothetical protein SAMN04487906_2824 [Zhouia amylolytica]|uniref:Uncharacterized protein n=1 Tax=Zhouia amylolytica TaxID=376730 RepID=A0A1I6V2Q1_9FLAO|nr:hypothetical protein [Zhouia amylolytica]SFT07963.1 hypothetical protein SAMN04487906_2824 [Zhouia amylolytica]
MLRWLLIIVLFAYLFMPLKNQVITVVHSLSHGIENVLNNHHHHTEKHTHDFQLEKDDSHYHETADNHDHSRLSLIASLFSPEEDRKNQQKEFFVFEMLDKHYPSGVYNVLFSHTAVQRKNNWGVIANYFSIDLPIIIPPPRAF